MLQNFLHHYHLLKHEADWRPAESCIKLQSLGPTPVFWCLKDHIASHGMPFRLIHFVTSRTSLATAQNSSLIKASKTSLKACATHLYAHLTTFCSARRRQTSHIPLQLSVTKLWKHMNSVSFYIHSSLLLIFATKFGLGFRFRSDRNISMKRGREASTTTCYSDLKIKLVAPLVPILTHFLAVIESRTFSIVAS